MRAFCTLLLAAVPLCHAAAYIKPTPTQQAAQSTPPNYASPQEAFQDLLNALPEESLQAALEQLDGWKDGVFETHHRGVEHVHSNDPGLATKIIVAAVQDLKKRQAPANSSAVASPSVQNTSAPPASSPPASSPPPNQETSQAPPPASSPNNPPAQTTTAQGNPPQSNPPASQPAQTPPPVVNTVTQPDGRTVIQTTPAQALPTAGQVITSVNSRGSTFVTTYTPGGGKVSSVVLITTTGADGKPSTMTSYAFVDPTGTATGKPGLQNGAAKTGGSVLLFVASIVSLAFLI